MNSLERTYRLNFKQHVLSFVSIVIGVKEKEGK